MSPAVIILGLIAYVAFACAIGRLLSLSAGGNRPSEASVHPERAGSEAR